MDKKKLIRLQFLKKRKKNYFNIEIFFFNPLIKILKKIKKNKKIISIYYPNSYELNILNIFKVKYFNRYKFLLPIIKEKNSMIFCKWDKHDILIVNKYGTAEPIQSDIIIPNIIIVPILAFDKNKNRLGYGKGFYDRYLNKYVKKNKDILTVGVAFSFQKHHNLPINKKDFKLDYIITEKGIIK